MDAYRLGARCLTYPLQDKDSFLQIDIQMRLNVHRAYVRTFPAALTYGTGFRYTWTPDIGTKTTSMKAA